MIFEDFFENILRKFKFDQSLTRIIGNLHEDVCTFMTVCHFIVLGMRNVADRCCIENQNTHFMFNKFFYKNVAIYKIMWKNMVEPGRLQIKI